MHDRVEFAFAADLLDELAVGQVAEDEFRARIDRLAVARDERVENRDFVTAVEQIFGAGAADVTRAAGDQNLFHDLAFLNGMM